ncbi:MAG: hypothetical protein NTZ19_00750 [Bacteroidetes bacterium]|nr:hypothetical protein [Bacteroidota bacterium]
MNFLSVLSFTTSIWVLILVMGICMFCCWGIFDLYKLRLLKKNYENALHGSDKSIALEAGKKYYGYKRPDGKHTIYDGIKIRTDITSLMN